MMSWFFSCCWHVDGTWGDMNWNETVNVLGTQHPLARSHSWVPCRTAEWSGVFLATWDFDGIFNAGLQAQEDNKTSLRLKKSRSKPSINYLSKSPVMGFRSHLSPTSTFRSRIPSIPRLRSHCQGLQVDPKSMGSTSVRPPLEVHRFDVDPIVVTFSWYLRDQGLEVRTNWLTVDRWQVSKSSIPWILGASRELLNLSTNASRIFSNSSKLSSVFKPVGSCKNHPVWINLQIVCVNDSTKVFDSSQHWDVVARHSQTSRTRCLTSWDR